MEIIDARITHHMVAMNQEEPRSQRVSYAHCHATETQVEEPENAPGKGVLHTHLGKEFAKDYSKSLTEQTGRPHDDKEIAAPQNEGFHYDIINHLSQVLAKVSLLDLIRMNENVRTSLKEALSK